MVQHKITWIMKIMIVMKIKTETYIFISRDNKLDKKILNIKNCKQWKRFMINIVIYKDVVMIAIKKRQRPIFLFQEIIIYTNLKKIVKNCGQVKRSMINVVIYT